MASGIGKVQVFHLKLYRLFRLSRGRGLGGEPMAYLRLLAVTEYKLRKIGRAHICRKGYAGILQRRDVKRLPDAALRQKIGAQKRIRTAVKADTSIFHENDSVYRPVEHILHPVLNDNHRTARVLLNFVNQADGLLAGSRIQVGKRLVKKENVHVSYHHAA